MPEQTCEHCGGDGVCPTCQGLGEINQGHQYDEETSKVQCPSCKGTKKCRACGGTGRITKTEGEQHG